MSTFKIERKKLTIDIYGTVYEISKPKFKQILETQEKVEGLNPTEKFKYIRQSLIDCGIPEAVIDDLDGESMVELIEIVNGSKKN